MNRLKELGFLCWCCWLDARVSKRSMSVFRAHPSSDGLKPETTVAVVATTRMRSGPGTEYPVIRTLKKGVEVVPLGTTGTAGHPYRPGERVRASARSRTPNRP